MRLWCSGRRKYLASIAVKNVNLNLKAAFNFASKPNILGLVWEQHAGPVASFCHFQLELSILKLPKQN
jgi:hypothetical protein